MLIEQDQKHILNLKETLKNKFEDLINQIYCFGSRVYAQRQDTDFDILIITSEKIDWKKESEIFYEILHFGVENDLLFDPSFYSVEEFNSIHREMPFIKNVRDTGILI